MEIDIVIPIFNETENLSELEKRLHEVFKVLSPKFDCRVIYVNDGSSDSSLQLMLRQRANDSRFSVIDLSRNFGHQAAITAGLQHTEGDGVIVMDGDLQDPPELIPELIAKWQGGAEVVLAQRIERRESGLRRIGFDLFHRFFSLLSDHQVHTNSGVFALMDRQVVSEFNQLSEKNRYIPGLRSWIGFDHRIVPYTRDDRAAGKPKQSLKNLFKYALDAVFSFSYKPLRLITIIGAVVSIIAFCLASFFFMRRILGIEIAQTGFTTLVTLILFFGGLQLTSIGLLGEYIARIYDEVKRRPLYIVRKNYSYSNASEQESAKSLAKVIGE